MSRSKSHSGLALPQEATLSSSGQLQSAAEAADVEVLMASSRRLMAPVPEEIPSMYSTPWYDYPPGEFMLETASSTPTTASDGTGDSSYDYPPGSPHDYPSEGPYDEYEESDTDYTPAPPGTPPSDFGDDEWSTYTYEEDGNTYEDEGDPQDPELPPSPPPSKAPPAPSSNPPPDTPPDEDGAYNDEGLYEGTEEPLTEDPLAESPYGGAPLPPDNGPGNPTPAIPGFPAGVNPLFTPPGSYASLPSPAKKVNLTALKEKADQELYNATGIISKVVTTVSAGCRCSNSSDGAVGSSVPGLQYGPHIDIVVQSNCLWKKRVRVLPISHV
jgi:hypothetical protein